jgi:hypothetical protein
METKLTQAKHILDEQGIEADIIPLGHTDMKFGGKRYEFKLFIQEKNKKYRNNKDIYLEMYLNIYEYTKAQKQKIMKTEAWKKHKIDLDKKPIYEFVEKE